jgi:hypothetical protein
MGQGTEQVTAGAEWLSRRPSYHHESLMKGRRHSLPRRLAMASGDSWLRDAAGIALLVAAIAIGLIYLVDGVAYLAGAGPRITIHIQSTRVRYVLHSDLPGDPPTWDRVTYGEGYYLDGSGGRHPVSLPGDDLRPGTVVHTRRPLLAPAVVFQLHSWWQAAIEAVLGIMFAAAAAAWLTLAFLGV